MAIDWIHILVCSVKKKEDKKCQPGRLEHMLLSLFNCMIWNFSYVQYNWTLRLISLLLSCSKENPVEISGHVCFGNLILLDQMILNE